jgi:hypothetical protein
MTADWLISVYPIVGGWRLSCTGVEDLLFLSGAHALLKAEAFAHHLAAAGSDVRLAIYGGGGQLLRTRRYFAAEPPAGVPPPA